jgi:hypothetical protein
MRGLDINGVWFLRVKGYKKGIFSWLTDMRRADVSTNFASYTASREAKQQWRERIRSDEDL